MSLRAKAKQSRSPRPYRVRDDIVIVDYEMGNLRSVQKAFEAVGAKALITRSPAKIRKASKIVLPGVGAFRDCMQALRKYRLIDPILQAIADGKPYLGICLGLQVLFDEGEEFGRTKGLGIIPGRVVRFQLPKTYNIPHMGWNQIRRERQSPLFKGLKAQPYFYFVHSYHAVPEDNSWVTSTTSYGKRFVSSVGKGKIFACQFHPEKSQAEGLKLLKNFSLEEGV